jgi:hypothetical protein
MMDFVFEISKALAVGLIFSFFLTNAYVKQLKHIAGWRSIVCGFGLIFFGMLLDILDNNPTLDQFFIGNIHVVAFLEQVVGYVIGFSVLALGIWQWIPNIVEYQIKQKKELEETALKVEELSKLLPICMYCKNIRNDKGYWDRIESYMEKMSDYKFTHGICDNCIVEHYGEELADKVKKKVLSS